MASWIGINNGTYFNHGVLSMSEIENSTENENWLLNLIDCNQYKIKALEQRVQTLEAQLKEQQEAIDLLLQRLGV